MGQQNKANTWKLAAATVLAALVLGYVWRDNSPGKAETEAAAEPLAGEVATPEASPGHAAAAALAPSSAAPPKVVDSTRLGGSKGQLEFCGEPSLRLPRSLAELEALLRAALQSRAENEAEFARQRASIVQRLRSSPLVLDRLAGALLSEELASAHPPPASELRQDPRAFALRTLQCETDGTRLFRLGLRPKEAIWDACKAFRPGDWASLEPDNGHAWLQLLVQLDKESDQVQLKQAWQGLLRAQRFDSYEGLLGSRTLVAAPEVPEQTRLIFYSLTELAANSGAGLSRKQWLLQHCGAAAKQDANRNQECITLTRALSKGGRSLFDQELAMQLAAQLEMPPGSLAYSAAVLSEAQAWRAANTPMLRANNPQPFSCEALRQDLKHLSQKAEQGEWPTILDALQRRNSPSEP